MAVLTWDGTSERKFETGVNKCVLYPYDKTSNLYSPGVAWNGVTAINESPSGTEEQAFYADNIKYASLRSAEELGVTIEAYTYPDEFAVLDGTAEAVSDSGVYLGQQSRGMFGLSYQTTVGDDTDAEAGYKINIIYGATASPSEQSNSTVNESPELKTFSWELTTQKEQVTKVNPSTNKVFKPTASMKIDSRVVSSTILATIEAALYGTASEEAYLPKPDALIDMLTADSDTQG